MDIIERIIALDRQLMLNINTLWTNDTLDFVARLFRESYMWIPLYVFLIVLVLMNFGPKAGWWILIGLCTPALCEIISTMVIKPTILRFRPCRDPELSHYVRFILKFCPKNSSFTSSHATLHFGIASYVWFTLKKHVPLLPGILWLWAAAIGYAQVYVGVHFPLDVICGGMVGTITGYGTSIIFKKQSGLDQIKSTIAL